MGLAGTGWGGLGLFLVGWGWGQGAGRWEPGVERSRCSHPRRTPGLCANLEKRFLHARELWQPGLPLSPVLSPACLAVWTQTKSRLSPDRNRDLSPAPKRLELRILELTLENGHLTQRPRDRQTGLLKATQQGQVSQGLTLHIWLKFLQHLSYPRAVNSWRGRPLFEYLLPGRAQLGSR